MTADEQLAALERRVVDAAHALNNNLHLVGGNVDHAAHYLEELLALARLLAEVAPALPAAQHREVEERLAAVDLAWLQTDARKVIEAMTAGATRAAEVVKTLRATVRGG